MARYVSLMRRSLFWLPLICLLALVPPAEAATGRIIKVLPFFLDLEGRRALSPSLFDRDAYQVYLRQHPEKRSGYMFDIHWKAKGETTAPLLLRVEMRGVAHGDLPKQATLEAMVKTGGWWGQWTHLTLSGEDYQTFGEVTAWRVTLWEGGRLLGEQKSFLW